LVWQFRGSFVAVSRQFRGSFVAVSWQLSWPRANITTLSEFKNAVSYCCLKITQ